MHEGLHGEAVDGVVVDAVVERVVKDKLVAVGELCEVHLLLGLVHEHLALVGLHRHDVVVVLLELLRGERCREGVVPLPAWGACWCGVEV